MSEVKANLIGAITVMDEDGAQRLWEIVKQMYSFSSWDDVESVEPDEIDLQMIQEAQTDPDCGTLASDAEIRAVLG